MLGARGAGDFVIENLENDTQYCFSIGYVNFGGYITTMPTTSSSSAVCATPTQVDGFLNRNTCFIATSAYGDVENTHVKVFRKFRDEFLLKNHLGRVFVSWYYSWSEQGAAWLDTHSSLKPFVRAALYPMYVLSVAILWILHHIWVLGILMAAVLILLKFRKKYASFLVLLALILIPYKSNAAADPDLKDPLKTQPYIESLKAGYELKPKFAKKVRNGAGVSLMTDNNFSVDSTSNKSNNFDNVYHTADKYNLSLKFFYEKQFLRDAGFGSLAPIITGHAIVLKGKGMFTKRGTTSDDTVMQFNAAPVFAGISYRFIAARFLVPYVQASFGGIPMLEQRNDGKPARRAITSAHNFTLGIAINLDWLHRSSAWDQYIDNEVLHTYFTFEKIYIRSHFGTVGFDYDATMAGLTFEF